jgi:2-phosphosulfolactate phosphatase
VKINILHMVEGARQARGAAVIIDVFRAFSFECYLIRANAAKIIPVASLELAYTLKREHPDYLLAGERHGVILPGFDYGNSPAQVEGADLRGKTVVHTTSAGTQGLENAGGADVILAGSLVNARAVAAYIRSRDFQEVSLVPMGWEARWQTEEDNLCAEYIKSLLEGQSPDISKEIAALSQTSGKKFFDPAQSAVFPTRDFELCAALDSIDVALLFERDGNGLGYIKAERAAGAFEKRV